LTSQTATRRLLITYPSSSDFSFLGLWFVFVSRSPDREKSLFAALVNRQTKKDPLAPSQKVLIRHKKSASTIDAQLPFEKV
jgi:hypothetical protein